MTRPPSHPNKPNKLAPPQPRDDLTTWLAVAAAILQQGYGIAPGTITAQVWRHAYVKGLAPEAATSEAAQSAYNARPASDRVHRQ